MQACLPRRLVRECKTLPWVQRLISIVDTAHSPMHSIFCSPSGVFKVIEYACGAMNLVRAETWVPRHLALNPVVHPRKGVAALSAIMGAILL